MKGYDDLPCHTLHFSASQKREPLSGEAALSQQVENTLNTKSCGLEKAATGAPPKVRHWITPKKEQSCAFQNLKINSKVILEITDHSTAKAKATKASHPAQEKSFAVRELLLKMKCRLEAEKPH